MVYRRAGGRVPESAAEDGVPAVGRAGTEWSPGPERFARRAGVPATGQALTAFSFSV